ncbi:MAG: DNA gyrase inhibitor YacG [Desulfuromonadales bacterium]|nr:DNA gyrase inhibitor YacG [Desulfuromonadales bacterium]MBN2793732.1 DNA gyrase inhibitor YacG [Desulfuromonadales bacterium]
MKKKLTLSCPRCGVETFWENNPTRPFCSEKCRLVDLGRWSNEEYSIQGDKQPRHDEDQSPL